MARHTYPIIANCNFSARDDATGKAVHAAYKAVTSGKTNDPKLARELDALEKTLAAHAERTGEESASYCETAEEDVRNAWDDCVRLEESRAAGYVD